MSIFLLPRRLTTALLRFFTVPNDNPDLTLAQYQAFSKQIPLLYFILSTNMISLCWTHWHLAPPLLTRDLSAAFIVLCMIRTGLWWWRRKQPTDAATAYRRLRSTNWLSAPIALFCTFWSLSLLPYGDAYHRAHVVFFMAITVVGCIFCLMNLRSAAFIVAVIVNVAIAVFFVATGEETLMATGVNVALVTCALISILLTQYKDFEYLYTTRQAMHERKEALTQQNEAITRLSNENLRLANLDSLTLVPNRRSFFDTVERAFDRARDSNVSFAVGVLDLDGFKPVNDLHGHSAGDKVLVDIAERLKALSGEDWFVARLGGDEFGLVIEGSISREKLEKIGSEVCAVVCVPIVIGAGSVQVTGSVGFAVYPTDGASGQDIYEKADYALYSAKRERRGGTIIFEGAQALEMSRQKAVEEAFLTANLTEEISLFYQPIVHISSGRCLGFEALARWTSPTVGPVSPAQFVPIAEHTGRIGFITRHLLQLALEQAAVWPAGAFLSFNLSANDLTSREGVLRLIAIIEASQVNPASIVFEITETAVMQDAEQARTSVALLRQFGVGVALDDFGTGYSSLSQVHNMPLTKLKIDKSFVQNIETSAASQKIVRSVIALSQDIGLDVIVEGVETEGQAAVLKRMGAEVVQGFLYSEPMSADMVRFWLEGGQTKRRRSS